MRNFQWVFIMLFTLILCCKPEQKKINSWNKNDVSYEKWTKEFVDYNEILINGMKIVDKSYDDFINHDSSVETFQCIKIPKQFDIEYSELCSSNTIKLFKKGQNFLLKEVEISNTENVVSLGKHTIHKNTRDSDLLEMFPESTKLINHIGGYQWAGIIRVHTFDNFVYLDLHIKNGQIRKIVWTYL